GQPRHRGEGLRLGTVRRPPRGVKKSDFAKRDYYDVWLPQLSPNADLVKDALAAQKSGDAKAWQSFVKHFRAEMKESNASHLLDMLAALSHQADFSVGCYCEDEAHCHRSVLRDLLKERKARFAD
ncbi:MAG TPA: DUF488 family protein, partial [Dongiaceae bacterium]|nr:DUF488 family protein [Dongiaceae bacterium]